MKYLKMYENYGDDFILGDVIEGYLEAALWSSGEEFDEYSIDDLSDYAREAASTDVEIFIAELKDNGLLDELRDEMEDSHIGHDLWLTRNGHGAGFWDRNLDELGEQVSEICTSYGTVTLYVSDDGKIEID